MKKSFFKRATSLVAATVLTASTLVSAFASSITIYPGEHTKTGEDNRYYAYQIFNGTVERTESGTASWTYKHEHDYTESGSPFDMTAELKEKLEALLEDETFDTSDEFAEFVEKSLKNAADSDVADYLNSLFEDAGFSGYEAWNEAFDAAEKALEEAYDEDYIKLEAAYNDAVDAVDAAKKEVEENTTALIKAEEDKTAAEAVLAEAQAAKSAAEAAKSAAEAAKSAAEAAKTVAEATQSAKQEAYDKALEEPVDSDKVKEALEELTDAKIAYEEAEAALEEAEAAVSNAEQAVTDAETAVTEAQAAVTKAQADVPVAEEKLTATQKALAAAEVALLEAQNAYGDVQRPYDNAQAKINELQAILESAYNAFKGDWVLRHTMTNIGWGSAIVSEEPEYNLVSELLAALADTTFGEPFDAAFDAIKKAYDENNDDTTAAQRVARVLAGEFDASDFAREDETEVREENITTEFLQKFAKVVASVVEGKGIAAKWDDSKGEKGAWVVEDLAEGYYLVVDAKEIGEGDEGDSIAPYFLDVLAGEALEVYVKSDAPSVDKVIETVDKAKDGVAEDQKTATAAIGDTIKYHLTGTLPENFTEFNKAYYYRFTDTMDKSLTFDEESVTITIKGVTDEDIIVVEKSKVVEAYADTLITPDAAEAADEETNANFSIKTTEAADNTTITVTFTNIVKLFEKIAADNEEVDLDKVDWTGVTVEVTYEAVLNDDAKIGEANENKVKLTYTNDPNSGYDPDKDNPNEPDEPVDPDDPDTPDDTTTTTEVKTSVFTFAIALDKQDTNELKLSGAGFEITKDGEEDVYATFVQAADDNGDAIDGEYIFVGWSDAEDILERAKVATNNEDLEETVLITEVRTSEDGRLILKGLNSVASYTFTETDAPEGYVEVDPFTVTIAAEIEWTVTASVYGEEDDVTLTFTSYDPSEASVYEEGYVFTGDDGTVYTVVSVSDYAYTGKVYKDYELYADSDPAVAPNINGRDEAYGYLSILVIDPYQKIGVPGTGGIGVYIFYILGGALVVLSCVALYLTRKKPNKED